METGWELTVAHRFAGPGFEGAKSKSLSGARFQNPFALHSNAGPACTLLTHASITFAIDGVKWGFLHTKRVASYTRLFARTNGPLSCLPAASRLTSPPSPRCRCPGLCMTP